MSVTVGSEPAGMCSKALFVVDILRRRSPREKVKDAGALCRYLRLCGASSTAQVAGMATGVDSDMVVVGRVIVDLDAGGGRDFSFSLDL